MIVSRCSEGKVRRWRVGGVVLCAVATIWFTAAPAAVPACTRVTVAAFCEAGGEASSVCLVLRESDEPHKRHDVDLIGRLTTGGNAIHGFPALGDRLRAGTLIGCRLLALGAREPARQVLNATLNSVVSVMESEGRSDGAAEALLDLVQVQIGAGFDGDADRALAAFDWSVRDMSMAEDAARVLALGGARLAEVGRRALARTMFADARAMAERAPSGGAELMQRIAALEADAAM